ncbi:hypothetical protein IV203_015537 [Nitzschia inconspicua]|uniref:Uncharacterized protein n=1 Tax=Nitzschia inconspicua TaxID=303405 RepID=A0A9K3PTJ9_9STRA|nr:hypothetical protein IV203_015537 [Nitzschia inconspicua]
MAPNGRILKPYRDAKAPTRTRQEKEKLKSIGCILGHFSKSTVGYPPKAAVLVAAEEMNTDAVQNKESNNKPPTTTRREQAEGSPAEDGSGGAAKKLSRTNWKTVENFPLLRDAML